MSNHLFGDSFVPGWPRELAVPYGGPYRAKVLAVHDGDTIAVEISLGFNVHVEGDIRIYGRDRARLLVRSEPQSARRPTQAYRAMGRGRDILINPRRRPPNPLDAVPPSPSPPPADHGRRATRP
jgi:hypothetical protein